MALILVVDDNRFTRLTLNRHLDELGHTVITAVDGQDALDQLETEQPAMIFTDLLMPNVTGFELLEQLQDIPDAPPAVVISADIQDKSRQQCLDLGCAAFLNKPFTRESISAAVTQVLGDTDG